MLESIDTPALIIEKQILDKNIKNMQEIADKNSISLRPHTKTHKTPEIANLQVSAGAKGITVAKLGEAEVMAEHGFKDIFIANIIIGDIKFRRMIELSEKSDYLAVAVDSVESATMLNDAFFNSGKNINVLLEINSGLNRCGLSTLDSILNLAVKIQKLTALNFSGIFTHGGHSYNALSHSDIKQIGFEEGEILVRIAEMLEQNQIPCPIISAGSTPTAPYVSGVKGITEIRPGNYVFHDMTQVSLGSATLEDCALKVIATVISLPEKGRAVIDAGHKSLALDKCPSGTKFADSYGFIIGKNAKIVRLSEEHGVIEFTDEIFKIGERLLIIPNHACAVMNLFDEVNLVENDLVLNTFKIAGRGKSR